MKIRLFTERGQALIILAFAAVGLFGIVGLAIDGSRKFSDQRHAQNAADTAALAAAHAKVTGLEAGDSDTPADCPPSSGSPSAVCTALLSAGFARATSNGYDGNLVTNTVEIYSPPISGPYSGLSTYVQVIITSYVNTTFARVLGIDKTRNIVEAVALLHEGGDLANGAMIISYDPDPNCSSGVGSGGGSVDVSGNGIVNLNGGGIFMNSDEVCGFSIPNCADLNISSGAGINSASAMDNIDQEGCGFTPPIPENLNQDPVVIPDELYWPDVPIQCSTAAPNPTYLGVDPVDGKAEYLIYPGFYTDFPQAGLVPNNKHIYMNEGVYCIDPPMNQDLQWSGASFLSLNGSTDPTENKWQTFNTKGVTLYIKSGGGFSLSINSPILLDATNDVSSDYKGYLIILEGTRSSIESCTINGGAYLDINGLIFAPYCDITVNGGSDSEAEFNAQLIGWDLKINGNNTINFNYDPSNQVIIKSKIGLMR